ncbi:MAG: BlaI/MecI/CopY family transcriptional regulator [Planctomycetales bacterium]|nr:BlaI/MecI/CopY family transcriptional regulator [Planctomycetales bacterium]
MSDLQLTKCELEIMNVVWDHDVVTVPQVFDALQRPLAYTSVMTMLKILEEKGFVERGPKRGRAYTYRANYSREQVSKSMVAALSSSLFQGSLSSFVLSLLNTQSLTEDEIQEVKSAIADLEAKGDQ